MVSIANGIGDTLNIISKIEERNNSRYFVA